MQFVDTLGVQVPQVNTIDQARLVASAAKYPPVGSRGVAFGTRAAGYGFFVGNALQYNRELAIAGVAGWRTGGGACRRHGGRRW